MPKTFQPRLVNGPFEDPSLYLLFGFHRRAFLFDLGANLSLAAKDLLKVSDVFVSHTHLDHFIGFDHLLRICLHRPRPLRLFGPSGIADNVEGKLRGYTWNLTEDYPFAIEVWEVEPDRKSSFWFRADRQFRREEVRQESFNGILLEEEEFFVSTAILDHRIPSLAFAVEEREKIQIRRERLEALGAEPGPWLKTLKRLIRAGAEDPTKMWVPSEGGGRFMTLGELKKELVLISRGEKVSYVVDALFSPENLSRIVSLVKGSDLLFCEASFLEKDKEQADLRYHLTARQAGEIARRAGVEELHVFHFSPRYALRSQELVREALEEFHR